jgi:putative aldouronate transport system substrate-binding protein
MKSIWKHALPVVMTGVLFLTATGCGSSGGKKEEGSEAGTSPNPAQSVKPKDPTAIRIMANFSVADPYPTDKAFVEAAEKKTNTKVTFEVPPSSGYKEKLQLMLASGNYPDLVFFPAENDETYLKAVKDGIVIPINKYLDKAPNLTKYSYPNSWDALKVNRDQNIYGIPRTTISRVDGYLVRKDWLDNLGIKLPDNNEVTIDEFTDILRKFTFNDPDKNGKNDTYGYAANVNTVKVLNPVLTYPLGSMGWQDSAGKYKYMDAQYDTSYKKVLEYTQQLYKEGVLDPDSAVNTVAASIDRFNRGLTGVRTEFAGYISTSETTLKKNFPNASLTYIFVKNEQGKVLGPGYGTGMFGLWAVTSSAKNPQDAVNFLDYMLSDEGWNLAVGGVEGIDYKTDNGKRVYNPDSKTDWRKAFVRRSGDVNFFLSTDENEKQRALPLIDKSVKAVVMTKDRGFTPPAAKKPNYMDYKKVMDETKMKIMTGAAPVSDWDKAIDGWYKNGGEDFVNQMIEYIQSVEKKG